MQRASQEKMKDSDKGIQLARAVSIAGRDTGGRVVYWDWTVCISAEAVLQKFLISRMKTDLKERGGGEKPTTLQKLPVRTRKLHRIADGLREIKSPV